MHGLLRAFLTDPKFPDPVVPPDLHLVRPVATDADGNVPCIYCRAPTPFAQALMIGSDGYACGRCNVVVVPPPPSELSLRRSMWPWLLGGAAVVAAVVGLIVLAGRQEAARQPVDDRDAELVRQWQRLVRARNAAAAGAAAAAIQPYDDQGPQTLEKVLVLGIPRDPETYHYMIIEGDVFSTPRDERSLPARGSRWTKLRETNVVQELGYVYFLDQDGDLARTQIGFD